MTDLPDRILEAIRKRKIASAMLRQHLAQTTPIIYPIPTYGSSDPQVEYTIDPRDDLRRCEADKRTVERHQLRGKSVLRNGEFVDYCAACLRVIPCPDLLDRAAAYDIEAP